VSPVTEGQRKLITAGIMLATVMGSLDTTVVNVSLPHMQGSLSASPEQITWVLTSYMVASAVMVPISGWLAMRIGMKFMLLTAVAGFTLTSVMCGIATSLPEMVIFRMLQGVMAAPLAPLAQAVLLNINPPERYGRAMALFTMGAMAAPVVGPVVGGYLTDDLSWRWCFYINLPVGIASMLLLWAFMPREAPKPRQFDFLGFGALAVAVASFQLMMDRGPSQDWLASREICVEAVLAAVGLWVFVTHSLTAKHPLFDPALAKDRNFVATTIFTFFFSLVLFSSVALVPLLMQSVLGYPVLLAGIYSMPRGVLMMAVLQVMGRADTMLDRRLILAIGMGFIVFAFWRMSQFDLMMGPSTLISATLFQGVGQGVCSVALTTLAFATLNPALRAEASSLSNLMRFMGGSIGVALMQALTASSGQRAHAAFVTSITPGDPVVIAALPAQFSPDTVQGVLALNGEITRQAMMMAYLQDFRVMALLGLVTLPLLLLMRPPRRSAIGDGEPAPVDAHAA